MVYRGSSRLVFFLAALLIFSSVAVPAGVLAQSYGIVLSTPFPGITANAGERVTFSIKVRNTASVPRLVDLSVANAPEGWETVLKGRGRVIHQVLVPGGDTEFFDLDVQIPEGAGAGDYGVTLRARVGGGETTLPLKLRVQNEDASGVKLVTDYPVLQGHAGVAFEFRVNLINDTPNEQMFSLAAHAPPGWEVTFQPSYQNKQVASLSLEAGRTQGLDVKVTPPRLVKAGEYPIEVRAVSARASATTRFQVVITGSYELNLTTPSGRLNASALAGRENPVTLLVENPGTGDLKNLRFSSGEPRNWSTRFEPEQLDSLPAGESREVKAFIKPDARAIAGDYVVSLRARTNQVYDDVELRVTVRTPTTWGLVGIGIVVAVIAGVAAVFRAYGRR